MTEQSPIEPVDVAELQKQLWHWFLTAQRNILTGDDLALLERYVQGLATAEDVVPALFGYHSSAYRALKACNRL